MLSFIIAGAVSGAVYGLAAVGLVLTYRTSGIFNFAHGAVATLGAYVFYALYVKAGIGWPVACVVTLLILTPALALGFERYARSLARTSLIFQVVGTVGILLIIEAVCTQVYGSNALLYPQFLPRGHFALGSANVTYAQVITTAVAVALTVSLWLFLRGTRIGWSMRAVVDDPDLLALSGVSPVLVRRWAWVIGIFLANLSGLLIAPSIGLDATALTSLVVQAFGAAAIGRFANLPLTWIGGVLIGVVASLGTKYVSSASVLSGLPTGLPFIVLFVALLVARRRASIRKVVPARQAPETQRIAGRYQLVAGVAVIAFLAVVPTLFPYSLTAWMTVLTDVMLFLSLGLLVRTSRQVSLCQVAFAAIGAVAFAKLTGAGVPWFPALLLSALIVVPIGALLAIPAARLSGLFLALATFGFGLLLQAMFYDTNVMFGMQNLGLTVDRPSLAFLDLSSDQGFYFVVLLATVMVALLVVWLVRSRLGRLLKVLGESPTVLETSGANILVTRILVFCLSAAIAAVAGALTGASEQVVTASNFDPFTSLTFMVVVVITVGDEPWYALVAAAAAGLIPAYLTSQTASDALNVAFGVGAILYTAGIAPGLPRSVHRRLARLTRRPKTPRIGPATPVTSRRVATGATSGAASELAVNEVTVRFGGLIAVKDVSLKAAIGRVTGVIGPNGAGKSTLFNVCGGLQTPQHGTVAFRGDDISRRRPSSRAQMGLGRTFQMIELCESLTVGENVRIGAEAGLAGMNPVRHVVGGRGEAASVEGRTGEALQMCGLATLRDRPAFALSTGQRRMVELARCLAGRFDLLLLDEPSSGLDRRETEAFGELLRRVTRTRGTGILLIEHDNSLTLSICDYIYVLDFGQVIFHGTPDEVRHSSTVQQAYLGDAALEVGG